MSSKNQTEVAKKDNFKVQNKDQSVKKEDSKGDSKSDMLKVSTFFRYINRREKFYMFIGTSAAVFTGILLPGMAILIGLITNTYDPDNTPEDVFHQME